MTEAPRQRLKSLMDGLELPRGFRLTPTREGLLGKLGGLLLEKGSIECYGGRVSFRNIVGRWNLRTVTRQEMAAFRAMGKAGWVKAPVLNDGSGRWYGRRLVFQDGLEQLAKRLAARHTLWEQRKEALLRSVREPLREIREKQWEARRILESAQHRSLGTDENTVLEAFRKLRELTQERTEEEARLEAVEKAIEQIPMPTEDEALTWLMERALRKGEGDGQA